MYEWLWFFLKWSGYIVSIYLLLEGWVLWKRFWITEDKWVSYGNKLYNLREGRYLPQWHDALPTGEAIGTAWHSLPQAKARTAGMACRWIYDALKKGRMNDDCIYRVVDLKTGKSAVVWEPGKGIPASKEMSW